MVTFSTRAAAKRLGIPAATLAHYIRVGKISRPNAFTSGDITVHVWTEDDIERVRQLLPKIANGRKTRYKKKQSAVKAKKQKTPARAPVPHKSRKTKKK